MTRGCPARQHDVVVALVGEDLLSGLIAHVAAAHQAEGEDDQRSVHEDSLRARKRRQTSSTRSVRLTGTLSARARTR